MLSEGEIVNECSGQLRAFAFAFAFAFNNGLLSLNVSVTKLHKYIYSTLGVGKGSRPH